MEITGNYELLEEFEHRGHKVEIMMADRGAIHCGVQHEYDETVCSNCEEMIEADKVLTIWIDDNDLGVTFANLDLSEAVEFAKQYIDDLDDDSGDAPVTAPPTDRSNMRRGRRKKDPNGLLMPPTAGTPANADAIIEKLKWAGEALRIIREVGKS